ncbi:MAG: MarR family winged helix-turn-helix transcriptional regulator [Pseudomonadota bacterium]
MLLYTADLVESMVQEKLRPLELRPRQALIIEGIARMGAVSQAVLAREFGVTAASISSMIDRLVASGFLTRTQHLETTRANVIALTPKGEALVQDIYDVWRDVDSTIRERLGDEKAQTFFALQRDLRNALGGKVPGAHDHTTHLNQKLKST